MHDSAVNRKEQCRQQHTSCRAYQCAVDLQRSLQCDEALDMQSNLCITWPSVYNSICTTLYENDCGAMRTRLAYFRCRQLTQGFVTSTPACNSTTGAVQDICIAYPHKHHIHTNPQHCLLGMRYLDIAVSVLAPIQMCGFGPIYSNTNHLLVSLCLTHTKRMY